MTDQEIMELNDLAKFAKTKLQLGPFWERFETMAGNLQPSGDGFVRRLVLDKWKVPVLEHRSSAAPIGFPHAETKSTLEYLALITGSGEGLEAFAAEQLDSDLTIDLRNLATAAPASIATRVVATLVLIDRMRGDEVSTHDFTFVPDSLGSPHRCSATTHRMAQRHLSELLITYPALLCNRLVLNPADSRYGELGPIAHAIACSRNAQFPRASHGGPLLTREAIATFASRPLTRLAMAQKAPALAKVHGPVRMQGLSISTAAFGRTGAVRPGLLASMVENSVAGSDKFPLNMLVGMNTGVANGRLFLEFKTAMTASLMQLAGLSNARDQSPVRYGNLNPKAQADTTGLLKALKDAGRFNLIDKPYLGWLVGDLMIKVEHFICDGDTGGSLGDRVGAFINVIVDSGLHESPTFVAPAASMRTAPTEPTASSDPQQSVANQAVARQILEVSFRCPPVLRETQPGDVGIGRFADAKPAFAQEFIAVMSRYGITTQEFRDQIAWCSSSTVDGWRHAIGILETRDAMKDAIAAATAAATAASSAGATTGLATSAASPMSSDFAEPRRARAPLRL